MRSIWRRLGHTVRLPRTRSASDRGSRGHSQCARRRTRVRIRWAPSGRSGYLGQSTGWCVLPAFGSVPVYADALEGRRRYLRHGGRSWQHHLHPERQEDVCLNTVVYEVIHSSYHVESRRSVASRWGPALSVRRGSSTRSGRTLLGGSLELVLNALGEGPRPCPSTRLRTVVWMTRMFGPGRDRLASQ